eukprot:TRINITY_DN2675_c0_g1_i1.p1 TRINITY_DN2675_c0_g1~~TRINITY_DN2675_c0_g1_i1.p1  ORF type:complete len:1133 (+),score=200.19 TRINITY_DN2675_c0_g1_i1:76-3474(+)
MTRQSLGRDPVRCGLRLRTMVALACGSVALITAGTLWALAASMSYKSLVSAGEDSLNSAAYAVARRVRDYYEVTSGTAMRYRLMLQNSAAMDATSPTSFFMNKYGASLVFELDQQPTLASLLLAQARNPELVVGGCDIDGYLVSSGYMAVMGPGLDNDPSCYDGGLSACGNATRWNNIAGASNIADPLKVTTFRKDMPCASWLGAADSLWPQQRLPGNVSRRETGINGLVWLRGTVIVGAHPVQSLYKKIFFNVTGPPWAPHSAFGSLSMRVGKLRLGSSVGIEATGDILTSAAASTGLSSAVMFLVSRDKELVASSVESQEVERRGASDGAEPGQLLGLIHVDNASMVAEPILSVATTFTRQDCTHLGEDEWECEWHASSGTHSRHGQIIAARVVQDSNSAGLDMLLVVFADGDEVVEDADDLLLKLVVYGVIVLVGTCGVATMLAQIVSRPIQQMTARIEEARQSLDLSTMHATTMVTDVADMQAAMLSLVTASVAGAEDVAQELAKYDLARARKKLTLAGAGMPSEMSRALEVLIQNLTVYREYLPDAVLHEAPETALSTSAAPGDGACEPHVCMCFTDIQSSTMLWETRPQGMHEALILHNDVIRRQALLGEGYEVKTLGDSFMLAFEDPANGLRFGLELQRDLIRQPWPEDLASLPLCAWEGYGGQCVWYGLRVRVALHWGPVRVEKNPLTRRCDYFGSTVNCTARLEGAIRLGGLVGFTDDLQNELGLGHESWDDVETMCIGKKCFRGVEDAVNVTVAVPRELRRRLEIAASLVSGGSPVPSLHQAPDAGQSVELVSMAPDSPAGDIPSDALLTNPLREPQRSPSRNAIRLGFQNRHGTVASTRIVPDARVYQEQLTQMLVTTETALDTSQGTFISFLGTQVTVSWNTFRPCSDHVGQSLHFLTVLDRKGTQTIQHHTGLATGKCKTGNLAALRKRFSVFLGPAPIVAVQLSELAEVSSDHILVTDGFVVASNSQKSATRAHLLVPPPCDVNITTAAAIAWALKLDQSNKWDTFEVPSDKESEAESVEARHQFMAAAAAARCEDDHSVALHAETLVQQAHGDDAVLDLAKRLVTRRLFTRVVSLGVFEAASELEYGSRKHPSGSSTVVIPNTLSPSVDASSPPDSP